MREWRLTRLGWSLFDKQLDKGIALVSSTAWTQWVTSDNKLHRQQFDTVEAAKLAVEIML